jgi:phage-related protein
MRRTAIHYGFAALALGALMSTAPARAQSQGTPQVDRDSDLTRQQLSAFDSFLDSHPEVADQIRKDPSLVNKEEFVENHADLKQYLQQHPEVREDLTQNPSAVMHQEQRYDRREDGDRNRESRDSHDRNDINRTELTNMDNFMDSHPEIAEQLRKNPELADDKKFVASHPELQEFLAKHPGVREEMKENPNAFMHREQRFDRREDWGNDRRDGDVTRGELSNMDGFMDSHPEIAEQLKKNPALIDDKKFVKNHPELQEFLANHPGVREEMKENPNAFMNREERFDQRQDWKDRDRDVTRGELAKMDAFMDQHPEVAEQLRKDPGLVKDKKFVESHPALQEFLASHPGVREEYKENPSAFMRREQHFDGKERFDGQERIGRDRDLSRGEVSSFHEFLEAHGNISGELSKNPSLATNQEYLENHPALRDYLKANPQVHHELGENPQSFVKLAQQLETTPKTSPKNMAEPKLK